jgi:hypothetical protein
MSINPLGRTTMAYRDCLAHTIAFTNILSSAVGRAIKTRRHSSVTPQPSCFRLRRSHAMPSLLSGDTLATSSRTYPPTSRG